MVQIANITPLSNFKLADKYNDMHLLLYHWGLESLNYNRVCRLSNVYKIADNSQFELRKEIDYDDFLKWTIKVKADEVIAPDVMYNFRRTKKLIEEFIPKVPVGMKIQGVVCGSTISQLVDCYNWLHENERIDVIAFSKHGCTIKKKIDHFDARQDLFDLVLPTHKPVHFLGVNHFLDFFTPGIRSIDGKFLAKVANDNEKIDLYTKVDNCKLEVLFKLFEHIK